MAQICQVTGKKPATGFNVSHSNRKTKRRFMPNIQMHRFWSPNENRYVRLKISAKGVRIVDRQGIDKVLTDMRTRGERV